MSGKFMLMFGILWTLITLMIVIPFWVSGFFMEMTPMVLFFLGFGALGITFIVLGIKKIVADRNTEVYGEECFAKITDVYCSGASVNGRSEFKADFRVYIPSIGGVRKLSEAIGFEPMGFPVNGYAKVKYYKNDINIIEVISKDFVPEKIREMLDSKEDFGNEDNTDYSNDGPIKFS